MKRNLALTAVLFAAAARADAPPAAPRADAPASRDAAAGAAADADDASPDLREALRAFYVSSLTRELQLGPEQARRLQPRIDALLDAQRDAQRSRGRAAAGVISAARLPLSAQGADAESAAAAVAAAERSERDALARLDEARSRLLEELTPRQGARLLAFEEVFARRVRELAAARRDGAEPPAPDTREPDARRPRAGVAPDVAPGGARDRDDSRDEWRETAMLLFTHDVRTHLELSDAHTLSLLPKIEALFRARLDSERRRRVLHARLRSAADDPATGEAELKALVDEARRFESSEPGRAADARHAIVATLSPVQAARFLLLEHRAERRLRDVARRAREWRGADRPGAHGQAGPPSGGPQRGAWPRRPGAQRDRGPMAPRR